MKGLRLVTHVLMIVGAINLGLVGFFGLDLISNIFGEGSMLTRIIFMLVGLSGLYAIGGLCRCCKSGCGCNGDCNCHKK